MKVMGLTGSLHSFKGSIHKIHKYKGKNNFTVEKSDRQHKSKLRDISGPWQVAQLVGASSRYAKLAG